MSETSFIYSEVDGRKLLTRFWALENAKASVQLIHGIAEHSGRYEYVAAALNKAGYQVFSHDHRSFGGSLEDKGEGSEFSTYGHFADESGWQKALDDIRQVNALLAEQDKPCFLLAHSMGSFMAQSLLQQKDIPWAGVALSGTKGPLTIKDEIARKLAAFEVWRCGASSPSPLADKLMAMEFNRAFKPVNTPYDWICSDPSVVDDYVNDPLCGQPFTTRLAKDLIDGLSEVFAHGYQELPRDFPLYLFVGDHDPVSEMAKGVRRLDAYLRERDFTDVSLKVWSDMRHETLNEPGRDQVLAELISWLDARV